MPSVSLKPTLNLHKFHFSKDPHHNFPSSQLHISRYASRNFPSSQLHISRSASHSNFPSSMLSFPNSHNSLTKNFYCKVGSEHWVSSLFFCFCFVFFVFFFSLSLFLYFSVKKPLCCFWERSNSCNCFSEATAATVSYSSMYCVYIYIYIWAEPGGSEEGQVPPDLPKTPLI